MDKKAIFRYLRILVSMILIGYIISRVDYQELVQVFSSVKIHYVFLGILLNFIVIVLSSFKWKILLSAQSSNVNMRRLVDLWFVGLFFNNFLPTSLGGDAVKAYYLFRHSKKNPVAVSSLIMLRFIGIVSGIILVSLTIVFAGYQIPQQVKHLIILFLVSLCLLMLLAILFTMASIKKTGIVAKFPKTFEKWSWLQKIFSSLTFYKNYKSTLYVSLLLTLLSQIILILVSNVFCLALGCNIHPINFFIFVPIINFIQMFPVSLNGLGVREGAYLYFFSTVGMSASNALSLSLLVLFSIIIFSIIGGIIYVVKKEY